MDKGNFIVKDEFSFKLYPHLKEGEILSALLREIEHYKLDYMVVIELERLWNTRFWVTSGYDGATGIKNRKHPSIANFLHDGYYRCGYGGKVADLIYKWLLPLTGYTEKTAKIRYVGIRSLGSYFRLRNYIKGNIKQEPYSMMSLYYLLKK